MNKKKFISIILMMTILLSFLPIIANASTIANGTCGDNVIWELDSNGTLTISGTGDMNNCISDRPWREYGNDIVTVKIQNGVTSIGAYAFYTATSTEGYSDYPNMTSLQIPNTVTKIGANAMYSCTNLKNITIPDSIESIGEDAFEWTNWYNNQPNGCVYIGKILYKYKGVMPDNTIIKICEGTTSISSYAFGSKNNFIPLKDIYFPDSLKRIGKGAFRNCNQLTAIKFNDGLMSIGNEAFESCKNLTSVAFPDSLSAIGAYAFYGCSLINVTLPDNCKVYSSSGFGNCNKLRIITIPRNVEIDDSAFYGCYGFKILGYKNSDAEKCADASKFETIYANGKCGENVYWAISDNTLYISGMGNMYEYSKNSDVPWYYYLSDIKTIDIESSITNISEKACPFVPEDLVIKSRKNSAAEKYAKSKNITFVDSIVYGVCGENANWNLNSDGIFKIDGNGATYDYATGIGKDTNYPPYTEYRSDIKSVEIGSDITTIGQYNFYQCTNLETVVIKNKDISISKGAFRDSGSIKDIYYAGSESEWQSAFVNEQNDILNTATIHYDYLKPAPTPKGTTVTATSVTTSPGSTVNVKVDLSGNKGFANLGVQVGYDANALTLTSVTNNSSVGAVYTPAQQITANPYNMGWDSTGNIAFNGTLATLTFKVKENAPEGKYPITVSYYTGKNGDYTDGTDVNYDENFNSLKLNYVNGAVTVSSHTPGDINGDGKVNNQDGTFLLRHLAGWNVNVDDSALDINGDGKINNQDGTVLLRYLAGWQVNIH